MLFVDIQVAHVIISSFLGYFLGMRQSLRGMRKQADSAVFLSDAQFTIGDDSRAGTLMKTVLGDNWREFWNMICYRMWKEDLLTSNEAAELIQKASESNALKNPDATFFLDTINPLVRDRLTFFFASLRTIVDKGHHKKEEKVPPYLLHGLFRTNDIPALSQVLPTVNESVLLEPGELCNRDGLMLRWLVAKHPEDWFRLAERLGESDLLLRFLGKLPDKLSERSILEVRLWASMRSQTVARTVIGAINYHIALEMKPSIVAHHSTMSKRDQVGNFVELVWSHQTHGQDSNRDRDVRKICSMYEHYPIHVTFDLSFNPDELNTEDRVILARMARWKMTVVWGKEPHDPDNEYFEQVGFFKRYPYAAVKVRYRKLQSLGDRKAVVKELGLDKVIAASSSFWSEQVEQYDPVSVLNFEVMEVAPRRLPIQIGSNKGNLTQGKTGNQRLALLFSSGEFVQAMDANMGSFIGEAFKVPFVLKRFHPSSLPRDQVAKRIYGFRENIFTLTHGIIGDMNAVSEWSFGTITQRVAAWLGVRMHYGHPDFIDSYYARTRGSVSKASPHINLSEDIFLGFNVKNRGEKNDHSDFLEWEKGREVSFNAASGFFFKVSSGNVGVWRSPDITEACMMMPTCDLFSFHYASVGYFLAVFLIDTSFFLYLGFHIMITLSSKTMFEVGKLGELISAEWLFGFGLVWYLPGLFEAALEYGGLAEGFRRMLTGYDTTQKFRLSTPFYWLLTAIFFNFQNKTKAGAVRQSINSGVASYIATGRPNADATLNLLETFLQYRKLQFHDAVLFIAYFIAYRAANLALSEALPIVTLLFCTVSWLVAPPLFAPYHSWKSLFHDIGEFWNFLTRNPADKSRASLRLMRGRWMAICAAGYRPASDQVKNVNGHRGQPPNLFEVVLADALFQDQRAEYKPFTDTLMMGWSLLRLIILLTVLPSSVIEGLELYLAAWVVHLTLGLVFGVILDLGTMFVILLVAFFVLLQASDLGTMLFSSLLFFQLLDTLAKMFLFGSRMLRRVGIMDRSVTSKNVAKGMTVIPGPDWKWDMKATDVKQNAAPGGRTIGTVTNCDQKSYGWCEVEWMHGTSGRYRIRTKSSPNCDLSRHPNWNNVLVEAVTLLFGHFHLSLFIGYVVLIVWAILGSFLCLIDSDILGGWHSSMLRLPSRRKMAKAEEAETSMTSKAKGQAFAGRGSSGPLDDQIILQDLQRHPWNDHTVAPKANPTPTSFIQQDPAFMGSGWKEVVRVYVRRLTHLKERVTLQHLRTDYGIVPVAHESKDAVDCSPATVLEEGGFLLFGFENNEERWTSLGAFLGIDYEDHEVNKPGEYEKRVMSYAERVFLPVYTFKIPHAWVGKPFGELKANLKFICGIKRANRSLVWFPDLSDSFREGDGVILTQGNARTFAHYRAKAIFGELALGAGWKQIYSVALPNGSFGEFSRFREVSGRLGPLLTAKVLEYVEYSDVYSKSRGGIACTSRAGYRASISPRVWPLGTKFGITPMALVQDYRGRRPTLEKGAKENNGVRLLMGFENNAIREEQLTKFLESQDSDDIPGRLTKKSNCVACPSFYLPSATAADRMEEFVEWKWHPVVNFRVPDAWKDKTVAQVMFDMVKQDGKAIPIVGIYRRSRWSRMRDPGKPTDTTRAGLKKAAFRSNTGLGLSGGTKTLDAKNIKITDAERERALAEGQSAGVALAADLRQALWFPGVRETFEIADEAIIAIEHGNDFIRMVQRLDLSDEIERIQLPEPDQHLIPPVSNVLRPGYVDDDDQEVPMMSSWGVRPMIRGGSDSARPVRPVKLPKTPEAAPQLTKNSYGEWNPNDGLEHIIWVMLDRRTSEIGVYPAVMSKPIEEAWRKLRETVSLYEYGHQTLVYLKRLEQVSEGKGRCDVRRVSLKDANNEICFHVYREPASEDGKPGAWRFADNPEHAEERRARLHVQGILTMPKLGPNEGWSNAHITRIGDADA
jgi:hypothetical protein